MDKKQKNGISLIALVITIIVVAILTAAVVITLNNTYIMGNAKSAVNATDLKQVQEAIQTVWTTAYANASAEEREDTEYFRTAVKSYIESNNIDIAKFNNYVLIITTKGATLQRVMPWTYKADPRNNNRETLVTNGIVDLKIGSMIDYDAGVEEYTAGWQVLGAEDGKLLILSKGTVGEMKLSDPKDATKKLNTVCAPFGTGIGAIYARSIKIEDVDRITGYNPNNVGVYDPMRLENGIKAEADTLCEYGMGTTFFWGDITNTLNYETTNGITNSKNNISSFQWYNKISDTWLWSSYSTNTNITTLLNDRYSYYPTTLTNSENINVVGLAVNSTEYEMLFNGENGNRTSYWLASSNTIMLGLEPYFGMFCMERTYNGKYRISTGCQKNSSGGGSQQKSTIRAVVVLHSDIYVTGNDTDGWTFSVN